MTLIVRPLLGDRDSLPDDFKRDIIAELERVGVCPGQTFTIVPRVPGEMMFGHLRTISDPDERRLGPFARDSETSRRAAIDNYPRQGSQRWKILKALVVSPLTRYEIMQQTGLLENSVRPRVVELIEGGWIEETDQTRPTGSKSKAVVLALTAKARLDNRLNPTIIEAP